MRVNNQRRLSMQLSNFCGWYRQVGVGIWHGHGRGSAVAAYTRRGRVWWVVGALKDILDWCQMSCIK